MFAFVICSIRWMSGRQRTVRDTHEAPAAVGALCIVQGICCWPALEN